MQATKPTVLGWLFILQINDPRQFGVAMGIEYVTKTMAIEDVKIYEVRHMPPTMPQVDDPNGSDRQHSSEWDRARWSIPSVRQKVGLSRR